jgi:hypothetical protein
MFARESYKFRKLLFENRVFTDDQLRALIEAGDIATYDRVRRESMARFGHSRNIVAAEQILKISSIRKTLLTAAAFSLLLPCLHAQPTTVTVQAGAPGKRISPDLVGIFFEDLSFAADGGLYAELIQNRSFDYSKADPTLAGRRTPPGSSSSATARRARSWSKTPSR